MRSCLVYIQVSRLKILSSDFDKNITNLMATFPKLLPFVNGQWDAFFFSPSTSTGQELCVKQGLQGPAKSTESVLIVTVIANLLRIQSTWSWNCCLPFWAAFLLLGAFYFHLYLDSRAASVFSEHTFLFVALALLAHSCVKETFPV
jgi:hypothetical protein